MKKVFIASRFGENKISRIRKKLSEELININIQPIDLDDNMAVTEPPLKRSLENLEKSDIVIVLLGNTYGTILKEYQKSYTHLEYDVALKNRDKIKTYIFGIGKLYKDGEIQYSDDINMKNWQKEILENGETTIGKYSDDDSVEFIVHSIIMNIYREENKVWFDEDTGLMWQVQVDAFGELGGRYHWQDIFKYKDDLNKSNYSNYNDWRIPTINELKTLLTDTAYPNIFSYDKETYIKKALLYSMTMEHSRFWSATSNPNDNKKAYGIHFGRRRKGSESENQGKEKNVKTRYIRCVRLFSDQEIKTFWEKIANSNKKEDLEEFIKKYPNSNYVIEVENKLRKLCLENENISLLNKRIKLHKQNNAISLSTLLFNDIKEGLFDDETYEAILKLKEIMKTDGSWKELTGTLKMPKNIAKKKKYEKTQEVKDLLVSFNEN